METDLQQAITLIKSGKKNDGGRLLAEIIKKDPRNLTAWLWMSSCVNSDQQRIYCLSKVLEIDPNHNMARSALFKLQQPLQPTEEDIVGKPNAVQQPVSNAQPRKISHPISNQKSPIIQPRYLTAFGGVLVLMGTFFPWAALVYYGETILERYSGLTQVPGMLTAVVGVAIIFISLFMQTKPEKANSLASSLLALLGFLMACAWPIMFYDPCFEAFFGKACEYETKTGTGFGYLLSMASLFLTFIFGLIPNPKK